MAFRIGIIVGSTREGRFSEYPASWICDISNTHPELLMVQIDLRDYTLPFFTDRMNPSKRNGIYDEIEVTRFAETIKNCDGYIIISPEYNRAPSAVLKNALDHIYGEFSNKPVTFISYGSVGGARAVEQLRLIAIEHQMAPIRNAVHIMAPWNLREADGSLKAGALDGYIDTANGMFDQLAWWARALKAARVQ